jgi:LysR family cyn operon transcriptional activator
MELRHLRSFLAVVETRHFGRAAVRVHVTQPALSQQIRALEDELGTPLLERGRGGVRLTAAGEVFRGHASRAVEDALAGQRAVEALAGREGGVLRVGYLPSFRALVAPALGALARRHPGVRLRAEEAVAPRVEARVADGRLDLGLSFAPTRSAEVEAEPLVDSRLDLVVGKRHPLAGARTVALARLVDEPFALLVPGLRARAAVDAYLLHQRLSPRVVFESNAVAAVLALVSEGLAVTIVPESALARRQHLPVLRLSPAPAALRAVLLWRRQAPRTTAAEALAAELRGRVRQPLAR